MHRQFFKKLSENMIIFKLIATIEEILFILHVVDGIYIKIHNFNIVYLHIVEYKY